MLIVNLREHLAGTCCYCLSTADIRNDVKIRLIPLNASTNLNVKEGKFGHPLGTAIPRG